MHTQKLFPSGAWQVSELRDGQLVTRTYYGYAKREAIAQFRRDVQPARKVNKR